MLIPAVAAFFNYKIVSSILILTCGHEYDNDIWIYVTPVRNESLMEDCAKEVQAATKSKCVWCGNCRSTACELQCPATLVFWIGRETVCKAFCISIDLMIHYWMRGVTRIEHFAIWNKWLIIDDELPSRLNGVRYDADIAILDPRQDSAGHVSATVNTSATYHESLFFEDVYVHLRDGVSRHPWAVWTTQGFQPWQERERIRRRENLKRYPMRIATPVGHYDEWYDGSFTDYLVDNRQPGHDSAIRCSYGTSSLILERLNAKEVVTQVELWATAGNSSMFTMLADGTSELSGGILRMQIKRHSKLDYVIPLWLFKVGFTYVSERESSSNMFVMPFTGATWAACAVITLVLMLAQRATAKADSEKEGAFVAVLATWLQQDASAVPEGASGRFTFLALSVCSMLVYAYYTSAIVSALMSAGGGGPTTLRTLADSRYSLASEDYEWIRFQMFDVFKPDWPDMEYLKRKKLSSLTNFYMDTEAGMQLVKAGTTAYHAEYNHVYPLMKILSDNQICKLQYVHTVPPAMTWLTTTRRGQWTEIIRDAGYWLLETGLAKRMVSRWQVKPPPCRAALLAERVSFGDVAPLVILTIVGFVASIVLLFLERFVANWQSKRRAIGRQ